MSNLSYSNIDRWLFELVEGNLSPEQIAQLESFLVQHPELDVDKDMWEIAKVDKQEYVYQHQQKFIKRRPVGIYMSFGFVSLAIVISLGFLNFYSSQPFGAKLNTQVLTSVNKVGQFETINSLSKKAPPNNQKQYDGIDHNIISAIRDNSPSFGNNLSFNNNTAFNSTSNLAANLKDVSNCEVDKTTLTIAENTFGLESLETEKVKEIPFVQIDKDFTLKSKVNNLSSKRFAQSDYKMSFGAKLNKIGRSIQRMMDNPVALKNTKDPYYHVPGMQSMDVNFGSVGTLLATRVQTISRAQWLGEDNQQMMNQLSIDGYSYGMRGGLGFQLNQNYYGKGEIVNYNASLIYSPKFSIARNIVLEPSVRFKMGNKAINSGQIQAGAVVEYDRMNQQEFQIFGTEPMGKSLWYKDLGLGLMVNTKWFYIGIQQDNLLRHFDNIYSTDITNPRRVGKHFVATIGTDYESKKENLTVSPYFVYQQKEALSEGWLGFNLRYHWLTVGGAISSNLDPAASIGLKFSHFMIAYNADYTYSQYLDGMRLSHQLTLRFLTKPSRIGQRLLNQ